MISFLGSILIATSQAGSLDVLVLDDGGSETADLVSLLKGKGYTVTCSCDDGLLESDFDGSQWSLADQEVVFWLDGDLLREGEEMTDEGQQALVDHVDGGGGLVHFGATSARYGEDGENAVAVDLLLLEVEDLALGGAVFEITDASHPITESYGNGDTFTVATLGMAEITGSVGVSPMEWTPVDGGGAAVAVATQDAADGRVVQFAWIGHVRTAASANLDYTDIDVARLLAAAVEFAARRPPEVDAGGPYSVEPGDFAVLGGSALDPDGGEVSCGWDLDEDGVDDSTDLLTTWDASAADGPLDVDLALTCTDDEGDVTVDTAALRVPNLPPEILEVSVPSPAQEGVELELSVTWEDPEPADSHTVTWEMGDGTELEGTPAFHTYAADGSYVVTVTVTDDDLDSDSRSFAWSVHNVGPSILLEGDTEGDIGEVLTFACSATDQGGDPIAISWDLGDGTTAGHLDEVKHAYSAAGSYVVSCLADDGQDAVTASLEVAIRVPEDNDPPGTPELLRPWNGELTGSVVELVVGAVADTDGSAPTLEIVLERVEDGTDQAVWLGLEQGLTSTSVEAEGLLPATYRWQSRGVDVHGLAGSWSVPSYFEVLASDDGLDGPSGCSCGAESGPPAWAALPILGMLFLRRRERRSGLACQG